ncbi:NAD(P)/FAD-dependent oxidoreductase [Ornithinimicrobium pekingense]|uniref:Pyridine nucleotide-disulfide oxidoreductase n=1 Tax=Ornithinimicrobium pekingense TaxID=384677 RepID=A0ABQ2F342_9MICO|nr:FAD-dependent oxidoreductase [Ornithinimicrobium pekingense]GGK56014.1 pyridine nucleotide-disulfide oxidoreductase [Ornithinimicrobium pekingense]
MADPQHIVVVGGGLAAASAVTELRERGFDGAVTLVGAEPHVPYERPPFSKAVLTGDAEPESAFVHPQEWYAEHDVELLLGSRVDALDLAGRTVSVAGRRIGYDRLLLATGAVPRRLPVVDDSGVPASYLRTLDDSLALRSRLRDGARVLVVGAGWIGLEVTSAARRAGAEVSVVDPAEVPLAAALGEQMGGLFADLHRGHGVDLRLRTQVTAVRQADGRAVVELSDGEQVRPDLVVVGVGARPDTALAEEAGLATHDGILVDATLRTSDPHVWAAGDVANHDHPSLGRLRVEHWDTAINQGRHAARGMLGEEEPYTAQPYFFTDQYDWGMEYVGRGGPEDELVVRGAPAEGLTAFWLRDGVVTAGMQINDWDASDTLRALVGAAAPERLRDPGVPLADLG